MSNHKLITILFLSIALLLGPSCITVNVNFPETAVQHAADDFVKDLYGTQPASVEETVPPEEQESKKPSKTPKVKSGFINFFTATAFAQSINMSTPKAREIKARMGTRVSEIMKWKSKGAIGESFDGNLVIKDNADQVKALVETENKDRELLYEEVQSVNALSDHNQDRIRKFFGSAFRSNSPSGSWIENESGKWTKK